VTETRFIYSVLRKLSDDDFWWVKLPDSPQAARTGKRTIDVLACLQGKFIGMEWKLRKNTRAFPITRVSTQQLITLKNIVDAGGIGLIVIGTYLNSREKFLDIFTYQGWLTILREAKKYNQKSIMLPLAWTLHHAFIHANGDKWDATEIKNRIIGLIQ